MARRGNYIDYNPYGRRRRRGPNMGMICGILIVIIVAILFGVAAYRISKNNIGNLPGIPSPTPVPGTPTPTPSPTPSPTPTPTPTPTPVPISPETGLPCTPTPTPKPAWNDNYLVDWIDDREKRDNVVGAYAGLTINTQEKLDKWLKMADETELNAVVIDVKADTGRVTYQMDVPWMQEEGICISHYRDMKALLKTLKEHGIYTIARVVCFKDSLIDNLHPEYMIYNKNTGELYKDRKGETWVNPYVKETWKYIIDIAEQAALDGFDEICFDYIRISTEMASTMDFGEAAENATEESIEEVITAFTKYACNRLKPTGVFVSASVYGVVIQSTVDQKLTGQNYVEMSRYLDYICPMVYPSHYGKEWGSIKNPNSKPYELLTSVLKTSVNKLSVLEAQQDTYAEVRPWLQAFGETYDGPMIRKQVDATYDVGYNTWLLWNASGNYVDGCFLKK